MKNIALIGCSSRKKGKNEPDKKYKASEIYVGNNFIHSVEEGLKQFNCEEYYILSGNMDYGLLHPDDQIQYYNVYLSNKNNKNNIKVEVIHKHKNTTSSHTIKGVLTDSSELVFDGIIRIPKDSQKCDGYLNHRAVLLSDNAKVKATPELEIYADDVKCSHGSAVGSLDENLLFYLMSRGIGAEEGKRILLKSFLSDSLPDSFETYIDEWMDENV
jgi:hypothetical protein